MPWVFTVGRNAWWAHPACYPRQGHWADRVQDQNSLTAVVRQATL